MRIISLITLTILLAVSTAYAQGVAKGAISGRITDPSDAPVAGATVIATNVETGAKYTASTSSDGYYTMPSLLRGHYSVEVTLAGFQKAVQPPFEVASGTNPTVNLRLTLGSVSDSITVSDKVSLVEFQNADRSGEIDRVRMEYTPTAARVAIYTLMSVPGAFWSRNDKGLTPSGNSGASGWMINGSQERGAEMVVDGVPNLTSRDSGNYGLMPSQETVQETKVITNPYSAEYGNTTGGVISITTRSGSNEYHGELFTYIRNTAFNANQFERNRANQPRTVLKYNMYGGIVTGRILRNKLFGTFKYQENHSFSPKSMIGFVPTQAMRDGDFSGVNYSNAGVATPINLYDPWTTTQDPVTKRYLRTPFANSKIPSSRINPVATALWKYIPLPNINTGGSYLSSNYVPVGTGKTPSLFIEWMPRVDWNISDTSKLMTRVTRTAYTEYSAPFYPTAADMNASSPFFRDNWNYVVDFTHTISPTSVIDIRTGMERYNTGDNPATRYKAGPKDLGFSSTFVGQVINAFPQFGFGGGTSGGTQFSGAGSGSGSMNPDQVNNLDVMWSKVSGKHNVKVGGQYRLERIYEYNAGNDVGSFSFGSGATNGPDTSISNGSAGNEVASFLLGVGGGSIDRNSNPARQLASQSIYAQDDIKLTPKLTMNIGLRWDHQGPTTDRFNALTGIFDTSMASPIAASAAAATAAAGVSCSACSSLKGGLTFPGVNGASRGIFNDTWSNFGPRLSFAYALDSKTAIRTGYGWFYGRIYYFTGSAGFSQTTSWNVFDTNSVPISNRLIDNPFGDGILAPTGSNLGASTNLGQSINYVDPNARPALSKQFSFEIQRELPWGFRLDASYVNNIINNLPVDRSLNTISADAYTTLKSQLNTLVKNPFYHLSGINTNSTLYTNQTVATQQLMYAYPQYSGVTITKTPMGRSRYDALQLYLNKRYSNGLSLSVAYTFSKKLTQQSFQYATDNFLEKTLDSYHVPQLFSPNFVYEFPIGKGKLLGANMPNWADKLAGGWQLSGLFRIQQGRPLVMNGNAIPNGTNPVPDNQSLDNWINKSAFTVNTDSWAIRRWPTILSNLRYPAIHNFDFGAVKKVKVMERYNFEFHVLAMNATNTPAFWDSPTGNGVNPASTDFGKIGSIRGQSNFPRQLELGARITF